MRISTALILLAATLLPLNSCSKGTDPQAEARATKRIETSNGALSPMALIPGDADLTLLLTDLKGRIHSLCALGGQPDASKEVPFSHVAIGFSAGSGKDMLGKLSTLQDIATDAGIVQAATRGWQLDAEGKAATTIAKAGEAHQAKMQKELAGLIKDIRLHPVYVVLSPVKGEEDKAKALVAQLKSAAGMLVAMQKVGESCTHGDFSGVKVSGAKLAAGLNGDSGNELQTAMIQALSQMDLYLLFAEKDGMQVIVLSDKLDEVNLPETPGASVLGTTSWDDMDANLGKDLIFASNYSAEFAKSAESPYSKLASTATFFQGLFRDLAKNPGADSAALESAAKGVGYIAKAVDSIIPATTGAATFQIWKDGSSFHAECNISDVKNGFKPSSFSHQAQMDDPSTVLFWANSPSDAPSTWTLSGLVSAGLDVCSGVLSTVDGAGDAAAILTFKQEVTDALEALGTINSGMGGTSVFMVDGKATAPAAYGLPEGTAFPRAAFYSDVTDRSKISAGWDNLLKAAGDIMTKCGQDAEMLETLPIVPSQAGDATSYTVSIPGVFTPDVCPNSTVSDKGIAIGTSSLLNKELVNSASGNTSFSSCKFVLRLAPLAKLAKGFAELDDEMSDVSSALDTAASFVESVNGTITAKDGKSSTHIEVKLK